VWHLGRRREGKFVQVCGEETLTKGPLVRPKRRCEGDIQIDVKEIGSEGVE